MFALRCPSKMGDMKLRAIVTLAVALDVCESVCMRVFSSFMHTHTFYTEMEMPMRCHATVPLTKYLNGTRTHLPPSTVYTRPRKINLFCSILSHTVLSYEIPRFEDLCGDTNHRMALSQIEIRCA